MLKHNKQHGFSLVELMISITILAVILSVAAPSFSTTLSNYRLRAYAESILNGIQLARSVALQRNEPVQFSLVTNGTAYGWSIQTQAASGTILHAKSSNETAGQNLNLTIAPANATTLTFGGTGRVVANSDASGSITSIDVDSSVLSAAASKDLRIQIASGGLIRMCDPNISSSTDVRYCTP